MMIKYISTFILLYLILFTPCFTQKYHHVSVSDSLDIYQDDFVQSFIRSNKHKYSEHDLDLDSLMKVTTWSIMSVENRLLQNENKMGEDSINALVGCRCMIMKDQLSIASYIGFMAGLLIHIEVDLPSSSYISFWGYATDGASIYKQSKDGEIIENIDIPIINSQLIISKLESLSDGDWIEGFLSGTTEKYYRIKDIRKPDETIDMEMEINCPFRCQIEKFD